MDRDLQVACRHPAAAQRGRVTVGPSIASGTPLPLEVPVVRGARVLCRREHWPDALCRRQVPASRLRTPGAAWQEAEGSVDHPWGNGVARSAFTPRCTHQVGESLRERFGDNVCSLRHPEVERPWVLPPFEFQAKVDPSTALRVEWATEKLHAGLPRCCFASPSSAAPPTLGNYCCGSAAGASHSPARLPGCAAIPDGSGSIGRLPSRVRPRIPAATLQSVGTGRPAGADPQPALRKVPCIQDNSWRMGRVFSCMPLRRHGEARCILQGNKVFPPAPRRRSKGGEAICQDIL